ncbi:Fic family protein [Pseudarthrobacter raffinosi]|uniref:Fic family protein n=1 Tax=Pseudarthrobacter raffinosi TaxID=2953651 RepID=UPI00208E33C6|nr:Fic family protein [Pseudarthrobacter sp. MDT3-28]MCO4236323.1 Fic family protein [Pseudarthrobacter sp. MDT3-28]
MGQQQFAASWPAGGYESHEWVGKVDAFRTSSYLSGMTGQSYNAFIPPLIADSAYLPSPSTAALAEEAAQAISRFDERYGEHVRPFAALLLRSESAASSRIENLTASARSLAEAELGVDDRANATLIVRNVRAMESALAAADNLAPQSILDMHRALMHDSNDAEIAGQWRDEQVWIGSSHVSPIGADFVPPHHSRVPALMEDVMDYARRTDLPAMVQGAVAHAQFETIHPFTDGNGRTGRALLHAMLKHRGVASHVTVPVSAGLLANVTNYHDALTAYRAGNPEPIITVTAEASFLAIDNGTRLADDVVTITESWASKITARRDSAVWPVLDLLARQPVVNAAVLETKLGLDYMRQKRALDVLEAAGVVVGVDKFKKGRFWRAPEMLEALDAFAERAGRRSRG